MAHYTESTFTVRPESPAALVSLLKSVSLAGGFVRLDNDKSITVLSPSDRTTATRKAVESFMAPSVGADDDTEDFDADDIGGDTDDDDEDDERDED